MRYVGELAVPFREGDHVIARRLAQGQQALNWVRDNIKRRRVMVQAGGNWGYWPAVFAPYFQRAVYTFEPDKECFDCLVANTQHLNNVVRFQAAIGHERQLVDLWRDSDTTGNQRVEGRGIYPTMRIDDLGLTECDLIYLDVEGKEADALFGAVETIECCKPTVVYEARRAFAHNADMACEFLEGLGYCVTGEIAKDIVMQPQ